MKQNFTQDHLIAYLYKETTLAQRIAVREAVQRDPLLAGELETLRTAKQQFPQVKFTAPKRSLQAVLNYSKLTALEEQV